MKLHHSDGNEGWELPTGEETDQNAFEQFIC